ncbi:MAG: TolC family protein [Spirochaetia bacterium]|nr:TolC family protein [Spirochaetia bacterium]
MLLPLLSVGAQPAETGNQNRESGYSKLPGQPDGKAAKLTMDDTIRFVLDNNSLVRIQQLEVLKSDTDLLKDEAQYTPKVGLSYQGLDSKKKTLPSTVFSGTELHQDAIVGSVDKLFSSGTYFRAEVSDTRYDSDAGKNIAYSGTILASLAQPPLHTTALTFVLRQELLKNYFGYSQRRLNDIARNKAAIQRQDTTFQLSQLVAKTMIDYWSLSISEESVKTSENLLNNTNFIRGVTLQKMNLGLAEGFEVNQWNALASAAESQLAAVKLDRNSRRRDLLRTMNLHPDTDLSSATQLLEDIPKDIDEKKDLDHAYKTRPDLANVRLQMENARLASEMAENALLPSVSLTGRYSSKDYGRHSNTAYNETLYGRYPDTGVEFKVEYPLWDEGAKVDARNAKFAMRQLAIQEEQIRRQVADEIRDGIDRIKTAHEALKRAKDAEQQTLAFYGGLLVRYRQGRFQAVAVKNALDSLVQAQQALTQAKINFNITLIRYELTRNTLFEKYKVNIDEVLDRMRK